MIFWLILEGVLLTIFYTLSVTPQDVAKLKALLRFIFVVRLTSIAYVIMKLKIFKVFCIDSASMKWPHFVCFWALAPPNIIQSC